MLAEASEYAAWDPRYLPLILASVGANFLLGRELAKGQRRWLLIAGIAFNLLPLMFFKYSRFGFENVGLGEKAGWLPVVLPLANAQIPDSFLSAKKHPGTLCKASGP